MLRHGVKKGASSEPGTLLTAFQARRRAATASAIVSPGHRASHLPPFIRSGRRSRRVLASPEPRRGILTFLIWRDRTTPSRQAGELSAGLDAIHRYGAAA